MVVMLIHFSQWRGNKRHMFPEYLVAVRQRLPEAGGSTAVVSSEQLQMGQVEEVGEAATTVWPQQLLGQNLLRHLMTDKQGVLRTVGDHNMEFLDVNILSIHGSFYKKLNPTCWLC